MSRNQNTTEVKDQDKMSAIGLKSNVKCIMGAGINDIMLNDSRKRFSNHPENVQHLIMFYCYLL